MGRMKNMIEKEQVTTDLTFLWNIEHNTSWASLICHFNYVLQPNIEGTFSNICAQFDNILLSGLLLRSECSIVFGISYYQW